MALALYRRYRPDTLDGVIGQDQVTVPLSRALDSGRITQAYLFSGPRGTGKTSTARILARCLNCEKGPTSHPCGKCPSCKDLATGGPGSVDVVEIDAASHNGVDDARQIRERAQFAPTRDRYKIFILDEAHMVTQQGFNALLKIVEEPPEHVIFIFATTEPDKVIGTIRSRTHHYPFRLVPPEVLGPYVQKVCKQEKITLAPGVLPLVLRAGGGSVRDTLSVLDQLMVGAKDSTVELTSATNLLGYTPTEMISGIVDALIDRDGAKLYDTVEKVAIGGFEPRRFVQDLLERFRDLIMVRLAGVKALDRAGEQAQADQADLFDRQAHALPLSVLTALADAADQSLSQMAAATSPRMKLELLAARLLEIVEEQARKEQAGRPVGPVLHGQGASVRVQGVQGSPAGEQEPPVRTQGSSAGPGSSTPQTSPVPVSVSSRPSPSSSQTDAPTDPDIAWKQVVASLEAQVRFYVTPPRLAKIDFLRNRAGAPHLVFTFDKPVSQHAFAMALTNGRKVTLVVLAAVRRLFGPQATIAPASTAANGETVRTMRSMGQEEQTKIKRQVALLTASLAMSGAAAATGATGKAGKTGKPESSGRPDSAGSGRSADSDEEAGGSSSGGPSEAHDGHHRGAGPGSHSASDARTMSDGPVPDAPAASDMNGFAAPDPQQLKEEAGLTQTEEHHPKHIAVPDAHDSVDPWAGQEPDRRAGNDHLDDRSDDRQDTVGPDTAGRDTAEQDTDGSDRDAEAVSSTADGPGPAASPRPAAGSGPASGFGPAAGPARLPGPDRAAAPATSARPAPVPMAGATPVIPEESAEALAALRPGQPVGIGQLAQVFAAKSVTTTGKKKAEEDVRLHADIHLGKKTK